MTGSTAQIQADPQAQAGKPDVDIYLSVVIPAYNESARLPDSLQKVLEYLESRDYPYEVLVVDDGSADNTADLAEDFVKNAVIRDPNSHIKVIRNPHRGKGYAVRTGMLAAQGRFILYSDADFSAPIEEVEKLLVYLQGKYDIAMGSREGKGAARFDEPFYRHLMGRVFNRVVQALAVPGIEDSQCGFKAFSADAARMIFGRQRIEGFGFEDRKSVV